jgi:hypothetical protein
VRLVDQHRIVLPAGNQSALGGIEHGLHIGSLPFRKVGKLFLGG